MATGFCQITDWLERWEDRSIYATAGRYEEGRSNFIVFKARGGPGDLDGYTLWRSRDDTEVWVYNKARAWLAKSYVQLEDRVIYEITGRTGPAMKRRKTCNSALPYI